MWTITWLFTTSNLPASQKFSSRIHETPNSLLAPTHSDRFVSRCSACEGLAIATCYKHPFTVTWAMIDPCSRHQEILVDSCPGIISQTHLMSWLLRTGVMGTLASHTPPWSSMGIITIIFVVVPLYHSRACQQLLTYVMLIIMKIYIYRCIYIKICIHTKNI